MGVVKAVKEAVYVVAARRSAFGRYGGSLKAMTNTDLMERTAKATLEAGNVKPENVDNINFGSCVYSEKDSCYMSRHVGLRIGIPQEVPSLMVNRGCGSSMTAIQFGVRDIILGDAEVCLAGGVEQMSRFPYEIHGARFGLKMASMPRLDDSILSTLTDAYYGKHGVPMGVTAENLAEKYNITRDECDAYALRSHQTWGKAKETGIFDAEIAPIEMKSRKGTAIFDTDEHAKPSSSPKDMAKLPTAFKKDGTVTAGNASGICDGAACTLLASEAAVEKYNLKPLAKIVGYSSQGCDGRVMGIGPVGATNVLLKATGLSLDNMDVIEINEAFAPQVLAVCKELGIEVERVNKNGGGISVGHPLAASGARIVGHAVHELRRIGGKYGLATLCIGGGQGQSVILENVQ